MLTGICWLVYPFLDRSNLIMIYLSGVAWVASRFGKFEAITASITGVLAFDFFFVPPQFSFAVTDIQYVITFFVMLLIGLLISSLTLRVKAQAKIVNDRERRTAALYDLSKSLSRSKDLVDIARETIFNFKVVFNTQVAILLPDEENKLVKVGISNDDLEVDSGEIAVSQWVYDHGKEAGAGTDTLPGSKAFHVPLKAKTKCLGVISLLFSDRFLDPTQRALIDAFALQVTSAIERILNEEKSRNIQVSVEREKLRSTLLSSVSHDLRTPLASIVGSASVLAKENEMSESVRIDLAKTIKSEAERLSNITQNVLDMTRLESGNIALNLDWCSVEELISSALDRSKAKLDPRNIEVSIPNNLPLIRFDAVLIEQLFVNLFENIARYTPEDCKIDIRGEVQRNSVIIYVEDNGPGLEPGEETMIFEKLYRAKSSKGTGFGLGLSICKAIVAAHGGEIKAKNRPNGGLSIAIQFSVEDQIPEVPVER